MWESRWGKEREGGECVVRSFCGWENGRSARMWRGERTVSAVFGGNSGQVGRNGGENGQRENLGL